MFNYILKDIASTWQGIATRWPKQSLKRPFHHSIKPAAPGEIGKVGHPTGSPAGLPFTVYVTLGKLIKLLVSQLPQSSEQDYK